jgi:hypothetical protein
LLRISISKIYFVPFNADYIGVLDTATETFELIDLATTSYPILSNAKFRYIHVNMTHDKHTRHCVRDI